MNKKRITLFVVAGLIVICGISLIGISHSYYVNNSSNEILSGNITGTLADFKIADIFVEGNRVNAMPSQNGYVLDVFNSYCFTSSPNIHDNNVVMYTNTYGEHVFGNIAKGDKCVLYFFEPMTYSFFGDDETSNSEDLIYYTGNNIPEKARIYHGVNGDITRSCATVEDHKKICFERPYTNYTNGYNYNSGVTFTETIKNNIESILTNNILNKLGVNGSCYAGDYGSSCTFDNISFELYNIYDPHELSLQDFNNHNIEQSAICRETECFSGDFYPYAWVDNNTYQNNVPGDAVAAYDPGCIDLMNENNLNAACIVSDLNDNDEYEHKACFFGDICAGDYMSYDATDCEYIDDEYRCNYYIEWDESFSGYCAINQIDGSSYCHDNNSGVTCTVDANGSAYCNQHIAPPE